MTPTQLSLRKLRQEGWTATITEHWNAFSRTRQDLFGIVDILAIRAGQTLAVQTTSRSSISARAKKIANSENIDAIRDAGWSVHIHGWRKNPKNGRYEVKIVDVS